MKRLIIALAILAGCTSETRFEEQASSYVGLTERKLIQRLGPETSSRMAGDAKLLTWERGYYVPHHYDSVFAGGAIITSRVGGGPVRCALTYWLEPTEVIDLTSANERTVTEFVVTSFRYEGNGCRS